MVTATDQVGEQAPAREGRMIWLPVVWFGVLLIVAYFPVLQHLVEQWSTDEDVSHGFFVPVVAGYIAWQRRAEILAAVGEPAWWGLGVMAWGAIQGYLGSLGAELFLQRTALLISLAGLLLVLGGTKLIRAAALPLLLLPFMIPLPTVVYNQITFPLQLFASRVAEASLNLLGIPVLRDGNILELASQKLSVVEACSGIRSLLSLSFLSVFYAYFFDKKVWMRWVLLFCTIPIAVLANAGRVTITGILSEWDTELAQGFFHELEGWIIFLIALVMLACTHALINRIYSWKIRKEPTLA